MGLLARGTPLLPLVEGVYTRGNRGDGLFGVEDKGFKLLKNVMSESRSDGCECALKLVIATRF